MRRVVITGMGIYSCIGKNLSEVTDSLYNGKSGIGIDPQRKEMGYLSALTGLLERPDLKKMLDRRKRLCLPEQGEYAYLASVEAFKNAGIDEAFLEANEVGVLYGNDSSTAPIINAVDIIREKNVNTDNIDETAKMVGIGAVIFQELSNNRIKDYVFSWDKVLNFEGETGPYVQYTHARAASVLRKAGEEAVKKAQTGEFDASYISSDNAYELVKLLYAFPEVIAEAGVKYEPSIVTRHIVDIAQAFNRFYHDEHVLVDNEDEKTAKLALVIAAKDTIKNGLGLLGIKAPEKM